MGNSAGRIDNHGFGIGKYEGGLPSFGLLSLRVSSPLRGDSHPTMSPPASTPKERPRSTAYATRTASKKSAHVVEEGRYLSSIEHTGRWPVDAQPIFWIRPAFHILVHVTCMSMNNWTIFLVTACIDRCGKALFHLMPVRQFFPIELRATPLTFGMESDHVWVSTSEVSS